MIILKRPWTRQPQYPVAINRSHPIARGLIGFLWLGPGGPRELVAAPWAITETGITRQPRQHGVAAIHSSTGIYGARVDGSAWYHAGTAITLLALEDHAAASQTAWIIGYTDGSSGYFLGDQYPGLHNAYARIYFGGALTALETGVEWRTGPMVRGFTAEAGGTARLYERGRELTSTAAGSGAIAYGATFPRMTVFGNADGVYTTSGEGYWAALWNRALLEAEVRSISDNPWLLFAPLPRRIWAPAAAGYAITPSAGALSVAGYAPRADKSVLLSGASVSDITATGATPRVTITY